jgi:hypothetical protein
MSVEMDRIQDENAWRAEYACAQARGMPPTQTVPARKFAADLICSLLPCTRMWTRHGGRLQPVAAASQYCLPRTDVT